MSASASTSTPETRETRETHTKNTVVVIPHAKRDEIPDLIRALKEKTGCGNIYLRSTHFPTLATYVVMPEDLAKNVIGEVLYTKEVTTRQGETKTYEQKVTTMKLKDKDFPPEDRSDRALYLKSGIVSEEGVVTPLNFAGIYDVLNNLSRRGIIPKAPSTPEKKGKTWHLQRFKNNEFEAVVRFNSSDVEMVATVRRFLCTVSGVKVHWSRT